MTTARPLGPIRTEDMDGPEPRFRFLEPLPIDLGRYFTDLHAWAHTLAPDENPLSVSEHGTTIITIPAGFDTDFSSIPVLARLVTGDKDKYRKAGAVHDLLFRLGAPYWLSNRIWHLVARSGEQHVGQVRGLAGLVGLHLGGWVAYLKRRRERQAALR